MVDIDFEEEGTNVAVLVVEQCAEQTLTRYQKNNHIRKKI